MELIPTDQFLEWAETLGIVLDPVYSPPKCLVYTIPSTERRFWNLPENENEVKQLVSHLMTSIGPWQSCYLWLRGGSWPNLNPPQDRLEAIRRIVDMGTAIPDGFAGAVKYPADEFNQMVGRITAHAALGWCVRDDLSIIPDDGRCICQTDHHGVVHTSCRNGADMHRLIEQMASGGYSLPTELLDWTFKRPNWMA